MTKKSIIYVSRVCMYVVKVYKYSIKSTYK